MALSMTIAKFHCLSINLVYIYEFVISSECSSAELLAQAGAEKPMALSKALICAHDRRTRILAPGSS
jgi:hypothetical protein